ncbi:hypothetical protein M432DRAFT_645703 [Thermoascus aurantiacus ATCC 26904]
MDRGARLPTARHPPGGTLQKTPPSTPHPTYLRTRANSKKTKTYGDYTYHPPPSPSPSPSPAPTSSPPPPLNPSTNSPTPFDGRDRGGVVGLIGVRRTPYRRGDVDDGDRKTSHTSRTHLYDIRKVWRDPLGRTYLYGMSEGTRGVEACGRKGFGGVGLGGSEFTVKSSRTDSEERKREKSGQVGTLLPGLRIRRGQQRRKTLSLLLPSHANNNNNRHDGDADVLHWHDTHGTLLAVETRRRWNGTIEATEPRLEIVAQLEGPAVLDFLVAAWCMRNYNEAREVTKEPFRWELWEWEDFKRLAPEQKGKKRPETSLDGIVGTLSSYAQIGGGF